MFSEKKVREWFETYEPDVDLSQFEEPSDSTAITVGEYTIRPFPPIPGKDGSKYNIFLQNGDGEGTSINLDELFKEWF